MRGLGPAQAPGGSAARANGRVSFARASHEPSLATARSSRDGGLRTDNSVQRCAVWWAFGRIRGRGGARRWRRARVECTPCRTAGRGLRRSREVPRGVFCSADFIKNGELQRILAKRVDVGRENSLWWTLATRGAGQIRAIFREVFTRLRIRLGHFKLPARPNTFLQSDFSRNRAEIERSRGHIYARGTRLDPSSRQISPKKTGFYLGLPCIQKETSRRLQTAESSSSSMG